MGNMFKEISYIRWEKWVIYFYTLCWFKERCDKNTSELSIILNTFVYFQLKKLAYIVTRVLCKSVVNDYIFLITFEICNDITNGRGNYEIYKLIFYTDPSLLS